MSEETLIRIDGFLYSAVNVGERWLVRRWKHKPDQKFDRNAEYTEALISAAATKENAIAEAIRKDQWG